MATPDTAGGVRRLPRRGRLQHDGPRPVEQARSGGDDGERRGTSGRGGGAVAEAGEGALRVDRRLVTKLDAEDTGNVVMFVPFGMLVPVLWPQRHRWVVPLGVATSVLIEGMQLTVATHRSPEWVDIWFNGWGVVAGYGVWVVGRLVWRRVATA